MEFSYWGLSAFGFSPLAVKKPLHQMDDFNFTIVKKISWKSQFIKIIDVQNRFVVKLW